MIDAIVRNGNITRVVIAPINAQMNAYAVRLIHAGPLPEALAAHLRHYISFQQHVVKAALCGERKAALRAFLL